VSLAAALARPRGGPRRWLGAATVLGLLLAAAPGDLAPAALRVSGAACAAGAAALLLRRALPSVDPRRLEVVSRQPLGREAGVALLEIDGRPLLVGYGPSGVRALRVEGGPGGAPPGARSEVGP
jgi:flagellar protein FliO/FliZ